MQSWCLPLIPSSLGMNPPLKNISEKHKGVASRVPGCCTQFMYAALLVGGEVRCTSINDLNHSIGCFDWLLRVLRTGFSLCSRLGVLECEREGRGSQTVVWLTQRVPDWKGGIDLGYSNFIFGLLGFGTHLLLGDLC